MEQRICIPCPPPVEDEANTIRKLAEYVVRNGESFEEKVRLKESANPMFSFLFADQNPRGRAYYDWAICSIRLGYTTIEQAASFDESVREHLRKVPPGWLQLLPSDVSNLLTLLRANCGSKDEIKALRQWVLHRAHSLANVSFVFLDYVNGLHYELQASGGLLFTKILHAIYAINDILFNGTSATTLGPYTVLLPPGDAAPVRVFDCMRLPVAALFQRAFRSVTSEAEAAKLDKMILLWTSKAFIDEQAGSFISAIMRQEGLFSPPLPSLYPLIPPQPRPTPPQDAFGSMTQPRFMQAPGFNPAGSPMFAPQQGQLPPSFMPPSTPLPLLQLSKTPPTALAFIPGFDLNSCSVGMMANVLKQSVKAGHPVYVPVDPLAAMQAPVPHIEPARMEARISDFYRKLGGPGGSGGVSGGH